MHGSQPHCPATPYPTPYSQTLSLLRVIRFITRASALIDQEMSSAEQSLTGITAPDKRSSESLYPAVTAAAESLLTLVAECLAQYAARPLRDR